MPAGDRDVEGAARDLAETLPAPLAPLAAVAYDLAWSWQPDGAGVFAAVDAGRWEACGRSPVALLRTTPRHVLERAAADAGLAERAGALAQALRARRERPAPGPEVTGGPTPERPAAFVCAEYGIHDSLPIYSGGLGALAGDILKEAADRALPLVAVGLFYRQGYFHQRIDVTGRQQESWTAADPDLLPTVLVHGADGAPLTVTLPVLGREVLAQIWRVDVGSVPLYLLDTDRPENDAVGRWITARLYVGDPEVRLAQYAVLGAGGMRALAALGIDPGLVHLNEGHGALAAIELARPALRAGAPLAEALAGPRERIVFTTHTPVPAGNDTYPVDMAHAVLGGLFAECGAPAHEVVRLARTHPDDESESFGVTQLALRTSRAANGVSARHGEVAREMWRALWPDRREAADVPIGHVTNGVHLPTWVGAPMRELLDRALGDGWAARATDPATWAALERVSDEDLWAVRRAQRAELVDWVRARSVRDRLSRGDDLTFAQAAAGAFDPDVLTIGFARRVATYKRLGLLLADAERAVRLLGGERRVQIVIAGKAHPRDEPGKALVQRLFEARHGERIAEQVVFLDDYDLHMAARYVRGCDVWVNLPRPPLEASGTSGMKNAANGGLQLSVLDGWWPEAHDGANGWALPGDVDPDHGAQDHRDGAELYRLLEEEVVPAFYERDERGLPPRWLARMRASLAVVPQRFGAGRMLEDYAERIYRPAPEGEGSWGAPSPSREGHASSTSP